MLLKKLGLLAFFSGLILWLVSNEIRFILTTLPLALNQDQSVFEAKEASLFFQENTEVSYTLKAPRFRMISKHDSQKILMDGGIHFLEEKKDKPLNIYSESLSFKWSDKENRGLGTQNLETIYFRNKVLVSENEIYLKSSILDYNKKKNILSSPDVSFLFSKTGILESQNGFLWDRNLETISMKGLVNGLQQK